MQRGWLTSADYRAFINALSQFRQMQEISQRDLARRIGKPPSFINKIELFKRRLDIIEFVVIAEAMGQSAGTLLEKLRGVLPETIDL